jgi:uncharacterized damage-inducible protein DinB
MNKVAEIREKKQASYAGLDELLGRLSEADWRRPVHGHAEGWTVRDALAHLVTAGAGLLRAAQLMAEGALRMSPDFDLDRWNQRQVEKQAERTTEDLRTELEALNSHVLTYLDQLSAAETTLDRRGQHAVFGDVSVEDVLRRIYRHEREHAQEIKTALQG